MPLEGVQQWFGLIMLKEIFMFVEFMRWPYNHILNNLNKMYYIILYNDINKIEKSN